jgi:hypothetical protein
MVSSVLSAGLTTVYQQLTAFAGLESFWTSFDTVFGTEYNLAVAQSFRAQWQSGNFSQLPTIEVIDDQILGNARGAYASSSNTIFLSDTFVETASQQSLEAVILEEFGHFVDAQVNQTDTAGDEGELFSAIVRSVNLSAAELSRIKTEDDHAIAVIGGIETAIEKSESIALTLATGTGYTIGTTNTVIGTITGNLTILDFESPLPAGLSPTSSFAQNTPIPSTATITDQYASLGVKMSGVALLNGGIGHAPSGTNFVGGIGSGSLMDFDAPLTFQFVSPIDGSTPAYINYFAISPDLWGSTGNNVTITGYDLNGTILGVTTYTETGILGTVMD